MLVCFWSRLRQSDKMFQKFLLHNALLYTYVVFVLLWRQIFRQNDFDGLGGGGVDGGEFLCQLSVVEAGMMLDALEVVRRKSGKCWMNPRLMLWHL